MKYLRKFETEAERDVWLNSAEHVKPNVVLIGETDEVEYNIYVDYTKIPLFIEAIDDVTISFSNTYEYSKNDDVWESGTSSTVISAIAGERVFFRASNLSPSFSSGIGKFTIKNGKCNVGGNVMSMAYGDNYKDKIEITKSYQFYSLFQGSSAIVDASAMVLPATSLANHCYRQLFYQCSNLIAAPELPATTLAENCYGEMFYQCSSLITAPKLPATTLANHCYNEMFYQCSNLITAPELPATTLANYCYRSMFERCYSLVNAPTKLPATILKERCYDSMFSRCSVLVTAPELPATTLVTGCYGSMFYYCFALNYVKAMFIADPGTNTKEWLYGVASVGTFVKNAAATWDVTGGNGIPSGWTVETAEA